jgi:copper chaperone CopZ
MKTITLEIKDMHCPNCSMTLQGLEDDLPGVLAVEASYRNQRAQVQFDESKVDIAAILAAIKALGYTPELK